MCSTRFKPPSQTAQRVVAGLMLVGGAGYLYQRQQRGSQMFSKSEESSGVADVGGPFDLVDDNGKRVTEKDFPGEYLLLYFGFTYCPDICPTELYRMVTVLNTLKQIPGSPVIRPIFISVDPERDTPERIKEYKKSYPADMVWLTGTPEQLAAAAKAYRCYYRIPDKSQRNTESDYLVDHSIFFYLVSPQNKLLEFFGKNWTIDELIEKMMYSLKYDGGMPLEAEIPKVKPLKEAEDTHNA